MLMPFTLAHPVAVAPLRRWCPKQLSFAGLVIGSVTPDLACCINDWEYFSHTMLGSVAFCLPVGLISLWILYRTRVSLVAALPNPHRETLLPLCYTPRGPLVTLIASLLVGSWIHIAWDLFTHDHSWLAKQMGSLSIRFPYLGTFQFRISSGLWLASSFGGVALLTMLYESSLRRSGKRHLPLTPGERRLYLKWGVILCVPLAPALFLTLNESAGHYSLTSFIRVLAMYHLGCTYVILAAVAIRFEARARAGP